MFFVVSNPTMCFTLVEWMQSPIVTFQLGRAFIDKMTANPTVQGPGLALTTESTLATGYFEPSTDGPGNTYLANKLAGTNWAREHPNSVMLSCHSVAFPFLSPCYSTACVASCKIVVTGDVVSGVLARRWENGSGLTTGIIRELYKNLQSREVYPGTTGIVGMAFSAEVGHS